MLSFWEKTHFTKYDFLVIGGGIVGLTTALEIIEKAPSASVVVLERGVFPTGASTKNAGFACFGSLTELLSDIKTMGEDKMLALVEKRWKGLAKLRKHLGDAAIDFRNYGGYELLSESQLFALDKIAHINLMLSPLFKGSVYMVRDEQIEEFGFSKEYVKSLVFNRFEGQIDSGKMMRSLIKKALSKDIEILTGVEVLSIEETPKEAKIWAKFPLLSEKFAFEAQQVGVCTNAFTKSIFPELPIIPGRGQVLITKPIPDLPFKGTFHYDEGFYYFRNVENRVLLGGGRNKDFQGETTTKFELTNLIMDDLKFKLKNIILPRHPFEIEQEWAGIMAFGETKEPILKKHSPHVSLGVRMGGMGVAIGSLIGEELAELMLENRR
ncbi:MAG: FAD-dependent oxidoreductase [Flammeovirgaceae bacterium]